MWADALLAMEQAHLLRLLAWGAASTLVGSALLAWMALRAQRSPLLRHFALQTAAWGAVEMALSLWWYRTSATRDIAAATRLDRMLWLNIGLDVGYVMAGVALAVAGWRIGRRLGLVGAGMGVVVQGLALALLDLLLATRISR